MFLSRKQEARSEFVQKIITYQRNGDDARCHAKHVNTSAGLQAAAGADSISYEMVRR